MPINVDTYVKRIPIATTPNLEEAIKQECDTQAARTPDARRLAAAFEAHGNVILIFQVAPA